VNAAAVIGALWGMLVAGPVVRHARAAVVRVRAAGLNPPAPKQMETASRAERRGLALIPHHARRLASTMWERVRRRERDRLLERALPLTLDVLTMTSRAGYTTRLALATTARWCPEVIGAVLARVERQCRLGASLADALEDVAREEPVLHTVCEALAVAERNGAPTADLLSRLADEARASLRRRAEAHARRVPVRLLFPLVFLVLPAFGLLTVVPALAAGLRNS